jgi:hypothetical protein
MNLSGEQAAFIFVAEVNSAVKMEAAWTSKEFLAIVIIKKTGSSALKIKLNFVTC